MIQRGVIGYMVIHERNVGISWIQGKECKDIRGYRGGILGYQGKGSKQRRRKKFGTFQMRLRQGL